MKYKGYKCLVLHTGEVLDRQFDESHFKQVGLPVMSVGMPQLEALELVNKWNSSTGAATRNFLYWV